MITKGEALSHANALIISSGSVIIVRFEMPVYLSNVVYSVCVMKT